MIEQYLPSADRAAKRYARLAQGRMSFDEYRSWARFGLMVAVRKFDPARGWTFLTFAYHYINGYLMECGQTDRRQTGWNHEARKAEKDAGHTGMIRRVSFVGWPTTENGDPIDFPAPDEQVEETILRQQQRAFVLQCARTERERFVLTCLLDGLTYRDISDRLDVTWQRVHQIAKPLLKRVKLCAEKQFPAREDA